MLDKINNYLLSFSRVPLSEKLFFVRHLQVMLRAGISLSRALNTLALQTKNARLARAIKEIAETIEKGKSFTESLTQHKDIFGDLFISMIESGEISGHLEEVLGHLHTQLKKRYELISRVRGALIYPAVILLAILGVGAFMFIYVLPKIVEMFKDFETELPLPTQILITVSNVLKDNTLIVFIVFAFFIALLVAAWKNKTSRVWLEKILLNLPVAGGIVKKINIAIFARSFSSLLKTNIMINRSLEITANILGNLHYKKAIKEINDQLKKGSQIQETISSYPKIFPPVVCGMISIGEETGELDSILEELSDFYESEIEKIMRDLPSLIEPVLILLLGLGVGGVAVAIIMPMYTLTQAI